MRLSQSCTALYFLVLFIILQSQACRFAIYAGQEPESMDTLFALPPASLCHQTYGRPLAYKEDARASLFFDESKFHVRNHDVNKDGWGIGWYSTRSSEAKRYRDNSGATDENNLIDPDLQSMLGIRSRVLFGHVRAATAGNHVTSNTHPFQFNSILWMHNGGIPMKVQNGFQSLIEHTNISKIVTGTTDSEHMGGHFLTNIAGNVCERHDFRLQELQNAIKETIKQVEDLEGGNNRSSLNIAVSDGSHVVVTRYRTHREEQPPSLYYARTKNALWIASEPLDGQLNGNHNGETRDWISLHKDEMLSYTVEGDTLQLECLSSSCTMDRQHRLEKSDSCIEPRT